MKHGNNRFHWQERKNVDYNEVTYYLLWKKLQNNFHQNEQYDYDFSYEGESKRRFLMLLKPPNLEKSLKFLN